MPGDVRAGEGVRQDYVSQIGIAPIAQTLPIAKDQTVYT